MTKSTPAFRWYASWSSTMSASSRTRSVCTSFMSIGAYAGPADVRARGHDARHRRATADGGRAPPPRTRSASALIAVRRATEHAVGVASPECAQRVPQARVGHQRTLGDPAPHRSIVQSEPLPHRVHSIVSGRLLRPRQVCTEVRPPAGQRLLVLARALRARAKRKVEDLDGLPCFELTTAHAEDVVASASPPRRRGSRAQPPSQQGERASRGR